MVLADGHFPCPLKVCIKTLKPFLDLCGSDVLSEA
jgi:hypothetical protein